MVKWFHPLSQEKNAQHMTYLITDIASEQDYSNELKELNSLKIDTKRQEVVLLKIGFKIIQSFQVLSKQ